MSGLRGRADPTRDGVAARIPPRAQQSLLDRLIDDSPESAQDEVLSPAATLAKLRQSVRRDIEALLNARRRWRSWPPALAGLAVSPLSYGIPDCTGGMFHGNAELETLRRDIEDTIRRFEPRFRSVRVTLFGGDEKKEATLRFRIEALLHAEPAPEPIAFDTVMDRTTADVVVLNHEDN